MDNIKKDVYQNLFNRTLKYDITVVIILCLVGLCIKFFIAIEPSEDGLTGSATSTIWGFGLVATSVLVVIFITFALINKISNIENCKFQDFVINFFKYSASPLILFLCLIWIIGLNLKFSNIINKDILPIDFHITDYISSGIIVAQVIIIFKYVFSMIENSKMNTLNKPCGIKLPGITGISMISLFLGIIELIILTIMTIILTYYITDG